MLIISGNNTVVIKPTVGELFRSVTMSEATFLSEQARLKGMNENTVTIPLNERLNLIQTVFEVANLGLIQSTENDLFRFDKIYHIREEFFYLLTVLFIFTDLQVKL